MGRGGGIRSLSWSFGAIGVTRRLEHLHCAPAAGSDINACPQPYTALGVGVPAQRERRKTGTWQGLDRLLLLDASAMGGASCH